MRTSLLTAILQSLLENCHINHQSVILEQGNPAVRHKQNASLVGIARPFASRKRPGADQPEERPAQAFQSLTDHSFGWGVGSY